MGDKVSKIKKGISKNLVKKVDFKPLNDKKKKDITGEEIVELLQTLIKSNNRSVTHFHMKSDELTDEIAKSLEGLLKTYTSESTRRPTASLSFGLKDVEFSSKGIKLIFSALVSCDVIGDLILHGTLKPIETSCIDALSKLLEKNNTLKRIDIGGFAVTQETTRAFVRAMSKQRTLTHLVLHQWELKSEDVKVLLNGCIFEFLDLTNCEINDDSMKVISEALKKNTTLKKLVLDKNKSITDKGVTLIHNALKISPNSKLLTISFEKNDKLDEDKVLDLVELLDERKDDIKSGITPTIKKEDEEEEEEEEKDEKQEEGEKKDDEKKSQLFEKFAKTVVGENDASQNDILEKV